MKTLLRAVLMLSLALPASAQTAPATKGATLETRTFELRHLKPEEAVSLLRPYLVSGGGTVSAVATHIPIVTIKDVPENIAKMESVLAKYDHSPATIRLVFQLIEADTGIKLANASNSGVSSDIDATLRSVLRFSSYKLLAQGVATAGEFQMLSQRLANADANSTYELSAEVGSIRLSDATISAPANVRNASTSNPVVDTSAIGSVHLRVELARRFGSGGGAPSEGVITTGLDVPLGHTVVLGTSATKISGVALILTVKPELVRVK